MNQKRIWEIDTLRGFLILCVLLSHTLYYSSNILGLFRIPPLIRYVMQYGGALFVILSGLSSTLGSNGFRRGLFVFAGGMVLTAGSYAGVLLGWLGDDMIIHFGVLHLLGFAMMLSPLLKKLPSWLLCVFGLAVVVVGYWLEAQPALVETRLLFPIGLRFPGFTSGDYFPMAPHLGWFCLGIVLGRLLYREKKTRFPGVSDSNFFVRFFCFCGRNSLYIFIIHLPIVGLLMMLISSQL
jgi:uncharacterized membrane protein